MHVACAVAAFCVVGGAGTALAVGPGVRAGDLVIHPRAQLGGGLDSNLYFASEDEPVRSATLLTGGAGLSLANRNPNHLALSVDFDALFRYINSIDDADGGPAPEVPSELNGLQSLSGEVTAALMPRSTFTLELHDKLKHTDRPAYEVNEAALVSTVRGVAFSRWDNSVGADLRFRPGDSPESRAFELRLGYRLQTVRFDDEDESATNSDVAEKTAHALRFLTAWRFLPKTTASLDFQYSVIDYLSDRDPFTAGVSRDRDSAPFRATLGLLGLVTNRISVDLKLGYLNTFNKVGDSFNSVTAKAEVGYVLEPTLKLAVGAERDGADSSYSNFVTKSGVFGRADLFFLTRLSLGGRGGYYLYEYSESGAPVGTTAREDPVLSAGAYLGVNIQDWLSTRLDWTFEHNMTDFVFEPRNDAGVILGSNPAEYTRHLVMLKVLAEY